MQVFTYSSVKAAKFSIRIDVQEASPRDFKISLHSLKSFVATERTEDLKQIHVKEKSSWSC